MATINVSGVTVPISTPRRAVLQVLAHGPAAVSSRTDDRARLVDWRACAGLQLAGLIAGGPSRQVWLTSRGLASLPLIEEDHRART